MNITLIKGISGKPTANIKYLMEKDPILLPEVRKKARMSTLITSTQYCTGCYIRRKRNGDIQNRKEEINLSTNDRIVYNKNPRESIKCY